MGGISSLGLLAAPTLANTIYKVGNSKDRKKVIIVGAGLAGLSTAYELTKTGHDVVLLEARMQPGGRVRTKRSAFAENFYVEEGAGRFPKSHNLTMRFIEEFGLETTPFYPQSGNLVTYVGKTHLYNSYAEQRNMAKVQLPFTTVERQSGEGGLFEKYVRPTLNQLGDITNRDWLSSDLRALDQLSWTEFLRKQGMSDAAIRFFNVGAININDGHEISALWLLRDMLSGGKKYKIKGGNDQLPRAFANRLAPSIKYGKPVKRIEQFEFGVEAFFKTEGSIGSVRGDYLVLATPFSVARRIDIPSLSKSRRQLISGLTYASASRVTLQFDKRMWEGNDLNGFATSDHPLQTWHPTFDQPGSRGILQAYIRLSLSRQLSGMSEQERVLFTLSKMEEIFPGLKNNFEGGSAKCWDQDPWAKGAASVHSPGQLTMFENAFDEPEGRIYFSGDHLSPWPAWMQGALYSGLDTASKIDSL